MASKFSSAHKTPKKLVYSSDSNYEPSQDSDPSCSGTFTRNLDLELQDELDSMMNSDIDSEDFYRDSGITKKIKMNKKTKVILQKVETQFTFYTSSLLFSNCYF
jgi:hypothetical protein